MPNIKDQSEDACNRQDMLLFHLGSNQVFGINVLKMKEIIPYEPLNQLPGAHPAVVGIANLRGHSLTVIDLSAAIGMRAVSTDSDLSQYSIIISEFSRMLQGFLVSKVDRIISLKWEDILPPPAGSGHASYITGVTQIDGQLVEILDVERVMHSVAPHDVPAGHGFDLDPALMEQLSSKLVMLVDDSSLARKQISKTLDLIGLNYISAIDGKDALDKLRKLQEEGRSVDLIISDIEMPEVDGYSLTREIRKDEGLSSVYILLHTSLSGSVSDEHTKASGADAVLTKFVTEELAAAVVKGLTSGKIE